MSYLIDFRKIMLAGGKQKTVPCRISTSQLSEATADTA